jgi:hypothetical protein
MTPISLSLRGALLILLAGCSNPRPDQSRSAGKDDAGEVAAAADYRPPPDLSRLDVCTLLPPAEIPERFGKVIEGPTSHRDPNGWPSCSYVLAPNTGLVVELLESAYYDMNRGMWDQQTGARDVPGVGEKAFLVPRKPPADPHLMAAKGYVAVKVTTRKQELAEEAAKIVLSKL